MPRVKGKPETPTLLTRTKKLRHTFKRLDKRVAGTPNEAHLMKYLASCERKLATFDPDSLTWIDYEAKAVERAKPPKKVVPLRVMPVLHPPAQQPPPREPDAASGSDDDGGAATAKKKGKKKRRSAIDDK